MYSKFVVKKPILWILDRMSAPIAIGATFIRFGNLMNHEIVGHVTNVPWAFKFSRFYNDATGNYDPSPRHPTQLYEALAYLLIFGLLLFFFWKKNLWQKPGLLFGSFLILVFSARFFIEFFKEGQTARDFEQAINTGQLLSIPFVIAGIYLFVIAIKKKPIVQ